MKLRLLGGGVVELYEQLIQFVVQPLGARLAAYGMNPCGELKMVNFQGGFHICLSRGHQKLCLKGEMMNEPTGPSVLFKNLPSEFHQPDPVWAAVAGNALGDLVCAELSLALLPPHFPTSS